MRRNILFVVPSTDNELHVTQDLVVKQKCKSEEQGNGANSYQ